jgi:hypothetical protein
MDGGSNAPNSAGSSTPAQAHDRLLAERAVHALDFLQAIEEHGDVMYDPEVVKLSIARYEYLWLPLCHYTTAAAGENMRAKAVPLDIAFVWHTHLLCPQRYLSPFRFTEYVLCRV